MPNWPNTIVVGLHNGNSAFTHYTGKTIIESFKRATFDASCFPGGLGFEVNHLLTADSVGALYERYPETPIDIRIDSKIWDPESRTVDVTFTMQNDGPDLYGAYGYYVLVTENNIHQYHESKDSCSTNSQPGQPYWDTAYFNHWVTREIVMDTLGNPLIGEKWYGSTAKTRRRSFTLKEDWVPYNCNVVIFVYQKEDSVYKSPVLQAIREPVTGPESIEKLANMEQGITLVYPNPAHDHANLHICLTQGSRCSLDIYDLNGQAIRNYIDGFVKPGIYNVEVDLQSIPMGTYLAVLETERGRSTRKIILIK